MTDDKAIVAAARSVAWRDLAAMRRRDGLIECLLPVPWLAAAWTCAAFALWPLALTCSFMFFLVALRLNHEAIHHNLGFGAAGHHRVMHALSMVMLGSNHSVAFNHLRHHAHLGTERDIEGKCGRMCFWRVVAYGVRFPVECHRETWRRGGAAWRGRMAGDLALNAVIPLLAWSTGSAVLLYHLAVTLVSQCCTALFAVWITHRSGADPAPIARTQRNRWVNRASYNMFFHLEHHLFPGVPVSRLPQLAARLDSAAPWIAAGTGRVIGRTAAIAGARPKG